MATERIIEEAVETNEKNVQPILDMLNLLNQRKDRTSSKFSNESKDNLIELKNKPTEQADAPSNENLYYDLIRALNDYYLRASEAEKTNDLEQLNAALRTLKNTASALVEEYQPAPTASESSKGLFSKLLEAISNMLPGPKPENPGVVFGKRYAALKEQIKSKEESKAVSEENPSPSI